MARGGTSLWGPGLIIGALLIGSVAVAVWTLTPGETAAEAGQAGGTGATRPGSQGSFMVPVQRGPLTKTLVCTGYIKGADAKLVECEVVHLEREGEDRRPAVTWIIEEGTYVKAGDLLMELDQSLVNEQILDAEGLVANANAEVAKAREALKVAQVEAQANLMLAEFNYAQAELALTEYAEGKFPLDVISQKQQIKVAETEYAQAQETMRWSLQLLQEGFITPSEVNADRLREQRAQVGLETARDTLKLMESYDHQRQLMQLQSDRKQKEFLVAKTRFDGESAVRTAQSTLLAAEKNAEREQEKLDQLNKQLAATRVVSPVDGFVVQEAAYEGDDDDEPLVVGSTVRYKQDLFYVIMGTELAVELKAPISKAGSLEVGQRVSVTPEGFPDLKLRGHISKVGLMPTNHYRNPDLHWYEFEVRLEEEPATTTIGMNCSGTVVLDHVDEATLIPVSAVHWRQEDAGRRRTRDPATPYVYVTDGKSVEERDVELALDDTRMVQVVSGLSPGEQVLVPDEYAEMLPITAAGAE